MNLQSRKQRLFAPRREFRLYLSPGTATRAAGVLSVWEQSAVGIWGQYNALAVATVECEDPAIDLTQYAGHVTVELLHRVYERGGAELSSATAIVLGAPPHLRQLAGARLNLRFEAENAVAEKAQRPRVFRVIRGGITAPRVTHHYWSVRR